MLFTPPNDVVSELIVELNATEARKIKRVRKFNNYGRTNGVAM